MNSALHLLQRIRDDTHRFAVQYHQALSDEVRPVLKDIPAGAGPTTDCSGRTDEAFTKDEARLREAIK